LMVDAKGKVTLQKIIRPNPEAMECVIKTLTALSLPPSAKAGIVELKLTP
jgi:hypothetical protein